MKHAAIASKITAAGATQRLDQTAAPDEVIRPEDVTDTSRLARLLTRVLSELAMLRRRFAPRRIDFEDVAVPAATSTLKLTHKLNGRVRWNVIDWNSNGSTWFLDGSHSFVGPALSTNKTLSDANTLVLDSFFAGTATIRVEEAG